MKNEEFTTAHVSGLKNISTMNTTFYNTRKRSMNMMVKLLGAAFFILHSSFFISCSDMLETDSSRQVFDPALDQKTDSVYYALGILQGMQQLADQYMFQGEMRGDLVEPPTTPTTTCASWPTSRPRPLTSTTRPTSTIASSTTATTTLPIATPPSAPVPTMWPCASMWV